MQPHEDELAAWREKLLGSYICRHLEFAVAEDLAQEAIARLLANSCCDSQPEVGPEIRLRTIFRNLVVDWYRRAHRHRERSDVLEEELSAEDSPVRDVELALVLIHELEQLGEGRALLFVLHDLYRWSSKRCAAFFGISPNSVDSKLSRTRDVLQQRLARFGPR